MSLIDFETGDPFEAGRQQRTVFETQQEDRERELQRDRELREAQQRGLQRLLEQRAQPQQPQMPARPAEAPAPSVSTPAAASPAAGTTPAAPPSPLSTVRPATPAGTDPLLEELLRRPSTAPQAMERFQNLEASRIAAQEREDKLERDAVEALAAGDLVTFRLLGSQTGFDRQVPPEIINDARMRHTFARATKLAEGFYKENPDQAGAFLQRMLQNGGDVLDAVQAIGLPRGRPDVSIETIMMGDQQVLARVDELTGQATPITLPSGEPALVAPNVGRQTDTTRLRAALLRQGHSPEDVDQMLINRARFQFRTNMLGEPMVFDRFTNQIVQPGAVQAQPGVAQAPGATTAEPSTAGAAGEPEPTAGPDPRELEGVDFARGTGLTGFLGNIANTVTDGLGFGLVAPDIETANRGLRTLQTTTELFMTASVPGRESNQVRDRLRALTVTPGSLLQGDERAFGQLQATRDFISMENDRLRTLLANPQGLTRGDRSKVIQNQLSLDALLSGYDRILGNFRSGQNRGGPPRGQTGTGGLVPMITTQEQYDALQPGQMYEDEDGNVFRKGGGQQ